MNQICGWALRLRSSMVCGRLLPLVLDGNHNGEVMDGKMVMEMAVVVALLMEKVEVTAMIALVLKSVMGMKMVVLLMVKTMIEASTLY